MSIESLRERARNFIENQTKKMTERNQEFLGLSLVKGVERELGISLVDHPHRRDLHPDPDYRSWGAFVQFMHKSFSIQSLVDPELRSLGKLNTRVSLAALIGLIERWRDKINSSTPEEFNRKLATYDNQPNGELMQQLLTKLRYAPEDRSFLAVLEEENKRI